MVATHFLLTFAAQVSNTGLQFMAYETMRRSVVKRKGSVANVTGFEFFIIGALAKAFSTSVTYPLQTVTRRVQAQDKDSKTQYKGTVDCATRMMNEEGIEAFYKGLKPRLLQMVLQNAIKLYGYEMIMLMFRWDLFYVFGSLTQFTAHFTAGRGK